MSDSRFEFEGREFTIRGAAFSGVVVQAIKSAYLQHLLQLRMDFAQLGAIEAIDAIATVGSLSIQQLRQLILTEPCIVAEVLKNCSPEVDGDKQLAMRIATNYPDFMALAEACYLASGAREAGTSSLGQLIKPLHENKNKSALKELLGLPDRDFTGANAIVSAYSDDLVNATVMTVGKAGSASAHYERVYITQSGGIVHADGLFETSLPSFDIEKTTWTFTGTIARIGDTVHHEIWDGPDSGTATLVDFAEKRFDRVEVRDTSQGNQKLCDADLIGMGYRIDPGEPGAGTVLTHEAAVRAFLNSQYPGGAWLYDAAGCWYYRLTSTGHAAGANILGRGASAAALRAPSVLDALPKPVETDGRAISLVDGVFGGIVCSQGEVQSLTLPRAAAGNYRVQMGVHSPDGPWRIAINAGGLTEILTFQDQPYATADASDFNIVIPDFEVRQGDTITLSITYQGRGSTGLLDHAQVSILSPAPGTPRIAFHGPPAVAASANPTADLQATPHHIGADLVVTGLVEDPFNGAAGMTCWLRQVGRLFWVRLPNVRSSLDVGNRWQTAAFPQHGVIPDTDFELRFIDAADVTNQRTERIRTPRVPTPYPTPTFTHVVTNASELISALRAVQNFEEILITQDITGLAGRLPGLNGRHDINIRGSGGLRLIDGLFTVTTEWTNIATNTWTSTHAEVINDANRCMWVDGHFIRRIKEAVSLHDKTTGFQMGEGVCTLKIHGGVNPNVVTVEVPRLDQSFQFRNCQRIYVDRVHIRGTGRRSGATGGQAAAFYSENTQNLTFRNSVIEKCHVGPYCNLNHNDLYYEQVLHKDGNRHMGFFAIKQNLHGNRHSNEQLSCFNSTNWENTRRVEIRNIRCEGTYQSVSVGGAPEAHSPRAQSAIWQSNIENHLVLGGLESKGNHVNAGMHDVWYIGKQNLDLRRNKYGVFWIFNVNGEFGFIPTETPLNSPGKIDSLALTLTFGSPPTFERMGKVVMVHCTFKARTRQIDGIGNTGQNHTDDGWYIGINQWQTALEIDLQGGNNLFEMTTDSSKGPPEGHWFQIETNWDFNNSRIRMNGNVYAIKPSANASFYYRTSPEERGDVTAYRAIITGQGKDPDHYEKNPTQVTTVILDADGMPLPGGPTVDTPEVFDGFEFLSAQKGSHLAQVSTFVNPS